MKNKKITVEINILRIVSITENHGGYLVGKCLLCNASGWLDERLGSPYGTKNADADLVHKKSCPINKELRA